MKNKCFAVLAAAALLSSCKPTPKEAANFNDYLMEQQKNVVVKYDGLLETYDTYVAAKMDAALIDFQCQVDESIQVIENANVIDGGEGLKQALLDYLNVYKAVADDDAVELVRIYKMPENELTPEIRVHWETKYKDVDTRLKNADKELKAVQASFAKDFNLKVQ